MFRLKTTISSRANMFLLPFLLLMMFFQQNSLATEDSEETKVTVPVNVINEEMNSLYTMTVYEDHSNDVVVIKSPKDSSVPIGI